MGRTLTWQGVASWWGFIDPPTDRPTRSLTCQCFVEFNR